MVQPSRRREDDRREGCEPGSRADLETVDVRPVGERELAMAAQDRRGPQPSEAAATGCRIVDCESVGHKRDAAQRTFNFETLFERRIRKQDARFGKIFKVTVRSDVKGDVIAAFQTWARSIDAGRAWGRNMRSRASLDDDMLSETIPAVEGACACLNDDCQHVLGMRVERKGPRQHEGPAEAASVQHSNVAAPREAEVQLEIRKVESLTSSDAKEDIVLQHGDYGVDAFTLTAIGKEHRPLAAHLSRLADHEIEIHANMRREISLVDDEEVTSNHPGAALARDVVSPADVDHEHPEVRQISRECGGQIVAPALDQNELDARKAPLEFVRGFNVESRVLANDRMGTSARLDRRDPRRVDETGAADSLGILGGDEIVGDDGEIDTAGLQRGN